jgi:hypothetical protein
VWGASRSSRLDLTALVGAEDGELRSAAASWSWRRTGLRKGGATPYYVVVGRDSKVAGLGAIDDTVWSEDGSLAKTVKLLAEIK